MNKKNVFVAVAILVILSVGLIGCNTYKKIYSQSEYWVGTYTFKADVEFLSTNHRVMDKENTITIYVELREDGTYRLLEKVQDVDLLITLVDYIGTWELDRGTPKKLGFSDHGKYNGEFSGYCINLLTEMYYINRIYISVDGSLVFDEDSDFHEDKCGIDYFIGDTLWR